MLRGAIGAQRENYHIAWTREESPWHSEHHTDIKLDGLMDEVICWVVLSTEFMNDVFIML